MSEYYWQHKPGIDCEITDRNHALLIKKRDALEAEILTVREVSGNRLQLWSDVCKERDELQHFFDIVTTERDQLKARVRRLTSALEKIMNYPETFVTSPEGHMRVIAKQALAEQEGE